MLNVKVNIHFKLKLLIYPGMPRVPKVYDNGVLPISNEIGDRFSPVEM